MVDSLKTLYSYLITLGNALQPLVLLAIRLFWGFLFAQAGLSKFADIQTVIKYFSDLGLPMPQIMAYIVATIETAGGACLIAGFASRLVSIPLIVTMLTAILTAHKDVVQKAFENPDVLTQVAPFTFLVASIIIFTFGPGAFSLDGILKRLSGK